ncbi:peptidylprolyl isomerase [Actibacterium pelagium]|nr:peptidylprolyl isomerase [Actibacterium pelagium]
MAALAQNANPFAPQIIVNGRGITGYELQQRILMLELLNSPGDLVEEAEKGLIEDRLRVDAGARLGVSPSPEDVTLGMEEFAGRANLNLKQFETLLTQRGIAPESFREFVRAGLVWREVVGRRFGPRSQITEDEIDRAIAISSRSGSARILISEIILRADTPEFKEQAQATAARLKEQIKSPGAFAAAARSLSVAPTGARGGRVDWVDLSNLPPALASRLLVLGPNEVSDPIPLGGNAIAVFMVRDLEELDAELPDSVSVEFARYALGDTAPGRVTSEIDTCDDLYGVAKGQPEERLQREVLAIADLDDATALTLAKLDENETAVVNQGGQNVLYMLCGRTPALDEDFDRTALRNSLRNQRVNAYADGYLAELRASAIIKRP